MNDKLLPELNNQVSIKVWELSCLLVATTLLGVGIAAREMANGHSLPATPVLVLALAFLTPPVAVQYVAMKRKAPAKPEDQPSTPVPDQEQPK